MHVRELFNLSKKTAIVTGGSSGLGEQISIALAEAGANVVVCSRKVENCEKLSEKIRKLGVESFAYKCDVSNPDDVNKVVDETINRFGRIDILVNNSGTTWGAPFEELTVEQWDKVMDVNVKGTFLMTQAVGRTMIKNREGKIIKISSMAGLNGIDEKVMNAVGYHASKGAVIIMTKDLAVKWGKYNINVNTIAPGFFPTKLSKGLLDIKGKEIIDQTPLKRFGSDYDLKGAALFLASPASNYVTGSVITVDGGFTAK